MIPSTSPLDMQVANELVSAWAQRYAAKIGVRTLLIKGLTLSHHGLRNSRISTDVDVLVEPDKHEAYCNGLRAYGWEPYPTSYAMRKFTLHSQDLFMPGIPVSLDVHRAYPGFLAPPADVFEILWGRRIQARFGQVDCNTVDRTASIYVMALHSLRGNVSEQRHAYELSSILKIQMSELERQDAASLALATRCVAPLKGILSQLNISAVPKPREHASPEYREWRRKIVSAESVTASWLATIREADTTQKLELLRHAVWPSVADLQIEHPDLAEGRFHQVIVRVFRIRRGLSQLPSALRSLKGR